MKIKCSYCATWHEHTGNCLSCGAPQSSPYFSEPSGQWKAYQRAFRGVVRSNGGSLIHIDSTVFDPRAHIVVEREPFYPLGKPNPQSFRTS